LICCKIKEKKKLDTKEFLRKQQETKISEGYNLINGAKLWYQIMWTSCDTIQARSNSDFDVKWATIQLYGNNHNSQSDRWIGLKVYMESPDMFSYLGLQFQINRSSARHRNTGQQRLYKFCYLLPFDLSTFFFARILFLKGRGNWFWKSTNSTKIFNGLQHTFQVWQGFIIISKSFSYKDSLFILATKMKEDFIINSTFRSDFLVYLGLYNGDKSDSSIFRMVIFGFVLFVLFFS
jgi:hypothetical protein